MADLWGVEHRHIPGGKRGKLAAEATGALRLPITYFAHNATVVGNDCMRTVLAARDVPAEGRRAAALNGAHDL